ncbi:hypothetical protein [Longimicrobium terrae]|uniref:DUF3150 domain-containing protein n=1 Tax=Longimicrobium terrae TaxID=1639882 RepID=A0A841GXG4_9BACT|nr:hypothetical protein [Longimicrobium terrae]MBB4635930.1 hypothetical protein [Longimicrobium terrae]MBB6070326.1 hypothetical protein [Longimicrobium terrae]NNC30827.1 hypothetical protein [Longimicrobium terrae]
MTPALAIIPPDPDARDFAAELQASTVACRLRHERLGTRRALTRGQIEQVAERFAADRRALSGSKRLLDTKDPAFRAVMRVHAAATDYWHSMTVPFPEAGIRLIRRERVQEFQQRMEEFRTSLVRSARQLQAKYAELRERARDELGSLFNDGDYPPRVDDAFSLDWDFPSVEPPNYLRQLAPELYARESERMRGRFEEAIRLTEAAFLERFGELVRHLAERLSGEADGRPKVFRASAITNLSAFFDEFQRLDIGSSSELQDLVSRAQRLVQGVRPDDLRSDFTTRTAVAAGLAEIQDVMDGMMVARPRRAISLVED